MKIGIDDGNVEAVQVTYTLSVTSKRAESPQLLCTGAQPLRQPDVSCRTASPQFLELALCQVLQLMDTPNFHHVHFTWALHHIYK